MTPFKQILRWFAACALVLLAQTGAQAGLGRPLSAAGEDGTVAAPSQRLAARSTSAAQAAASIQSQVVQTPRGATVTEYADATGTVFALTWRGPFKPDLQQLLGAYFKPYLGGRPRAGMGLAASSVHGDDIVVHSAGRMRNFYGVAWVPSLVPAGFDVSSLQP
ncbi:DUF2844 domain-containing protein [Thiomonas sp. FB-Cd]|uniref:DUF2844 domain-containing protein n=1 Tax=Thiomonas sp. FB-Cd TaxID=1158292 RepID=UPI000691D17A|nr:DUF2844 domain-containing protein [Thiomonas sp. FB-Cd]